MATNSYDLTASWSATARFTAVAETPVRITNPRTGVIFYDITTDDTPPSTNPILANPVQGFGQADITLAAGERLWLASNGAGIGNVLT